MKERYKPLDPQEDLNLLNSENKTNLGKSLLGVDYVVQQIQFVVVVLETIFRLLRQQLLYRLGSAVQASRTRYRSTSSNATCTAGYTVRITGRGVQMRTSEKYRITIRRNATAERFRGKTMKSRTWFWSSCSQ